MSSIMGTYRYLHGDALERVAALPKIARLRPPGAPVGEWVKVIALRPLMRDEGGEVLLVWARSRFAPDAGWHWVWWHVPWPQRLNAALAGRLQLFLDAMMSDATPEGLEAALAPVLIKDDDTNP